MSKTIMWERDAWSEYLTLQKADKKLIARINKLIEDILRNPFSGIGTPEPLKGNLSGLWSRRINSEHRLVYCVEDDQNSGNRAVRIFACKNHY